MRTCEDDSKNGQLNDIQVVINKAMRIATGTKLSDRVSIRDLCESTNTLSLNQMSAFDKLSMVWKSINDPNSPLHDMFSVSTGCDKRVSRSQAKGDVRQSAKTTIGQANLPYNAIKLWNKCDAKIRLTSRNCRSVPKTIIKKFVKSLPI